MMTGQELTIKTMHFHVEEIRSRAERQQKNKSDNIQEDIKTYKLDTRTATDLGR